MSTQTSDSELFTFRAYSPFTKKTGDFTASVGVTYGMDTTSSSIICTPPSSPNNEDWFIVFDVAKKWGTHQAVVGSGSNNFIDFLNTSGIAGPYVLNAVPYSGQSFIRFVWDAALSVWSVN